MKRAILAAALTVMVLLPAGAVQAADGCAYIKQLIVQEELDSVVFKETANFYAALCDGLGTTVPNTPDEQQRLVALIEQLKTLIAKEKVSSASVAGIWMSKEKKVFDKKIQDVLDLTQSGDTVSGTLSKETVMPFPQKSWATKYCEGNKNFHEIIEYQVSASFKKGTLKLTYAEPKIALCTCPAKCKIEDKGGSLTLKLKSDGAMLQGSDYTFTSATAKIGAPASAAAVPPAAMVATGTWVSKVFSQLDKKFVDTLVLTETGGKVTGTIKRKMFYAFPQKSWKDKYCNGAEQFEEVKEYPVTGTVDKKKGKLVLKLGQGSLTTCTCPGKCKKDFDSGKLKYTFTDGGFGLKGEGTTFSRK